MPSGKLVHPLFGILFVSISLFFGGNENAGLAAPEPAKPYIVVIDPGHGGTDTGTSARLAKKRISEKAVALAISLKVQKLLKDPNYKAVLGRPVKVILTRNRDRNVSLEARSEKARKAAADLFVSIHANSDPTRRAQGLETYFLNNTDDESAQKLQQIENRTSQRHQGQSPASLLIRSVAADAVVESSRSAAEILHSSLVDHLRSEDVKFQDRGVRQAMFYVLLDAQVPAVLVESFFLSHPHDLELVAENENRDRIAEGITKGILRYLAVR